MTTAQNRYLEIICFPKLSSAPGWVNSESFRRLDTLLFINTRTARRTRMRVVPVGFFENKMIPSTRFFQDKSEFLAAATSERVSHCLDYPSGSPKFIRLSLLHLLR